MEKKSFEVISISNTAQILSQLLFVASAGDRNFTLRCCLAKCAKRGGFVGRMLQVVTWDLVVFKGFLKLPCETPECCEL